MDMKKNKISRFIIIAIFSALLFGASTPISKMLLNNVHPFQLAGLLYIGAAIGVLPFFLRRYKKGNLKIFRIAKKNIYCLLGAIVLGGIAGPIFLLFGLQAASSASVSMWLNMELVATAILGVVLFKDYLGKYGWIGVIGTIIASVLITWHEGEIGIYAFLFILAASVCWGFDNHFTAKKGGMGMSMDGGWGLKPIKSLENGTTELK